MPAPNDTPAALLQSLATSDPTRPRLTWYGPDERIELSGRVLANWVAKAANLLQDELDVGPGSVVAVDLPGHWRAAYWLLAAWSVGASVEAGVCQDRPDVVVTDDPDVWPGSAVVAVSLRALVRGWSGAPLASGTIDEARELASYPDAFAAYGAPGAESPALTTAERSWTFAELLPAARAVGITPQARVLTSAGLPGAVGAWLAPWAVDGSLVLVAGADRARLDQIARDERVTARL